MQLYLQSRLINCILCKVFRLCSKEENLGRSTLTVVRETDQIFVWNKQKYTHDFTSSVDLALIGESKTFLDHIFQSSAYNVKW